MNTNCLKGMRCPNPDCGSYGPFRIEITVVVEMKDDGCDLNEYHKDLDFEDHAYCECVLCSFEGQVFEFQKGGDAHNNEFGGRVQMPSETSVPTGRPEPHRVDLLSSGTVSPCEQHEHRCAYQDRCAYQVGSPDVCTICGW